MGQPGDLRLTLILLVSRMHQSREANFPGLVADTKQWKTFAVNTAARTTRHRYHATHPPSKRSFQL